MGYHSGCRIYFAPLPVANLNFNNMRSWFESNLKSSFQHRVLASFFFINFKAAPQTQLQLNIKRTLSSFQLVPVLLMGTGYYGTTVATKNVLPNTILPFKILLHHLAICSNTSFLKKPFCRVSLKKHIKINSKFTSFSDHLKQHPKPF